MGELGSLYEWACEQYDHADEVLKRRTTEDESIYYWGGKRQAYKELKIELRRRMEE